MNTESNTPISAKPVNRFQELDALRGIAALIVVLFHLSMWREAAPYLSFGVAGVDLFFIISGFVIMKSLSDIKTGGEFIIKRFTRLFPTYWVCVTLTSIGILLLMYFLPAYQNDIGWGKYFANMTMLQRYFYYDNIDGPYWTMALELVFYTLMLLLFYLRLLKYAVWILLALSIGMVLLTHLHWTADEMIFIAYVPVLEYIALFLAGLVLYKMYVERKFYWYYYVLVVGCYFMQLSQFHTTVHANAFISFREYVVTLGVFFTLLLLFVHGRLGFIVNPVTLFLGKISYSLYLIHQFVSIGVIVPLMGTYVGYWWAAFGIALPVAIGLGTLITYTVEIPAGKRWKRFLYAKFITKKPANTEVLTGL